MMYREYIIHGICLKSDGENIVMPDVCLSGIFYIRLLYLMFFDFYILFVLVYFLWNIFIV